MSQTVRVRYAPSPTGKFHVGGARTALFNWLYARKMKGSFILRIEDTDRKRFSAAALEDLLEGLRWLGLDWDEGPEVGGEYGPYWQSQRLHVYREYIDLLLKQEKVYRCFCSTQRLEALRREQMKNRLPPGYDRHCRGIAPNEAERRAAAGEPFVVRLKMPTEGVISYVDLLRGVSTVENRTLQDAVLLKSDGIPTYHFANVVDDHLMDISHILRGDEWLASVPLHIHLYAELGWPVPTLVHLPIILNPAGKGKISKREERAPDGSVLPVFIESFRKQGYLPEAMINFLALIGWSYDDHTELMTREELIERFSLERINTTSAAWNYDKLNSINGYYIRQLTPGELAEKLLPFFETAGLPADLPQLEAFAPLIQERIKTLGDAVALVDFIFQEAELAFDPALLVPKGLEATTASQVLREARTALAEIEFSAEAIEQVLRDLAARMGLKEGQLFTIIRVAASGKTVAPPLFGTLALLGKERTLKRLRAAQEMLDAFI